MFLWLPLNSGLYWLIISVTFFSLKLCETKSYERYRVVRIEIKDAKEEALLIDLTNRFPSDVDLWTEPTFGAGHADLLVAPSHKKLVSRILKRHHLPFKTVIMDVQSLIDSTTPSRDKRATKPTNISLTEYHSYTEIMEWIQKFVGDNRALVKQFNLSKSFEGRDLMGLKIGTPGFWKPAVWIDSGMHAREWIAPATAVYVAQYLVKNYQTDLSIRNLLEKFDFYVLPVANPDGYEYSWTDDRLWRKTKSVHPEHENYVNKYLKGDTSLDCFGVDVNRNFGYHWGELGANTDNPCSNVYAGPQPFSEPEARAMKEYIQWEIPRLKLYLSFHSYGQIWLGAWGYASHRPSNYLQQKDAATEATKAIFREEGSRYTFGTIADLMYPASGTSIDYFHSIGVPYAFAVELRPEDDESSFGFMYPPRYIEPTGKEIVKGLLAITGHIGKTEKL